MHISKPVAEGGLATSTTGTASRSKPVDTTKLPQIISNTRSEQTPEAKVEFEYRREQYAKIKFNYRERSSGLSVSVVPEWTAQPVVWLRYIETPDKYSTYEPSAD